MIIISNIEDKIQKYNFNFPEVDVILIISDKVGKVFTFSLHWELLPDFEQILCESDLSTIKFRGMLCEGQCWLWKAFVL